MTPAARAGLIVLLAGVLGACADAPKSRELVVLVPDSSGKVGSVVVSSPRGSSTLSQAYSAARYEDGGSIETRPVAQEEVKKTFSVAIAAQPLRPISFLLYFEEGTDEYTAASKLAFDKVFKEVARRKVAEIAVIGHTDRVGRIDSNDVLSRKRAERVRKDFVDRGIPPDSISVAGRGEREPIIATADETSEPRNRRVEINVR